MVLATGIGAAALAVSAPFTAGAGEPTPITMTYAGDSTTARPDSWLHQLDDPALVDVGGTAISGATSLRILRQSEPRRADVLVVMVGVNDIRLGQSDRHVEDDVDRIVDRVGAHHVVLSAIAPSDLQDYGSAHIDRRARAVTLDIALRSLAARHGWSFVDPYADLRTPEGGWVPGTTIEGVHPDAAASRTVRDALQRAVHEAAELPDTVSR